MNDRKGQHVMTYDEAMTAIRRSGRTATRDGAGFEIGWRFGHAVMLGQGSGHIAYTPTREDMHATDWNVWDTTDTT